MAEALGISAAVVQFLDIAVRLSVNINWLCSELRDVPQWLHRFKLDLDQQVAIAQCVQSSSSLANISSSPSSGLSSATPIDGPLNDYLRNMRRLQSTFHAQAECKISHPIVGLYR